MEESAKMKVKVYKTVVRIATMCGLETAALNRQQGAELEVAEITIFELFFGSG